MDNSVYIALSKQLVQFRKVDIHAHNMANSNTPSYKHNQMMVTDWTVNNGNRQKISFAQDLRQFRDPIQGSMKLTGNALDMAIDGDAYFAVETLQGKRYTRAGNFKIDPQGFLVTNDGLPVMAEGGERITIPQDAREIRVLERGMIAVDGNELAQLEMTSFDNEQKLKRLSATLFADDGAGARQADNFRVNQGFIEASNVQPIIEITEMITTQRRVSSTAEFMDTAYEMQRKALNAWAKVE